MKKILALILAAVMLLMLFGCSATPASQESDVVIDSFETTPVTDPVESESAAAAENSAFEYWFKYLNDKASEFESAGTSTSTSSGVAGEDLGLSSALDSLEGSIGVSVSESKVPVCLLYNAPFYDKVPEDAVEVVIGEESDELYIIPRFVGSELYIYEISENPGSGETSKLLKESFTVEDGFIVHCNLFRPEGFPKYELLIKLADGTEVTYQLAYNGDTGTKIVENLFIE